MNLTAGPWEVDVLRDRFHKVATQYYACTHSCPPPTPVYPPIKVSGAVRLTDLIDQASFYYRTYIALASSLAEMDLERRLLQVSDE